MKLVRNEAQNGKYAVINLQEIPEGCTFSIIGNDGADYSALINFGHKNTEDEFFVLMLKDTNSEDALLAYADSAEKYDPEFATEVRELATRSGQHSPFCKIPD